MMYKKLYEELMDLLTEGLEDNEFSLEFGERIAEIDDKKADLESDVVRNSEILQAHREEIDDMRKDIDLLINSNIKNGIWAEDETKPFKVIYSEAVEGYNNKLNHLRELFEKLININTQAFCSGAMTAREYSKVTNVRKEYEELMEG